MQTGIEGLVVTEMLLKDQVFRSQDSLATYIIGIHPLPTTWQGTAVEDNHQTMVISIAQHIFVKTHRFLLIASPEINLDTLHAQLLHPAHLLLANDRIIHLVCRALSYVVPVATGTIPQENIYFFALCIGNELFHTLVANIFVPPGVNQYIFIAHFSSQINETYLIVIVDTIVLPQNPTPCTTTEAIVMFRFITRCHNIPSYSCLHNGFQRSAYRQCPPGRTAWQGKSRFYRSVAVVLFGHGESYPIKTVVGIAQVRAAITAVHSRLTDQHPAIVAHAEKAGECIAMSILRTLIHWSVCLVFFFITGFGPFPTNHGIALRTKESCSLLGEVKTSRFFHYPHTTRLALSGQSITKSNIIATDTESNRQRLSLRV